MERRRALAAVLAVGAVIGAVMVLFPSLSPLSDPPSVTTADSPSLDPSLPDPYDRAKGDPTAVIQVGDGENGLPVRVWNDNPERRTVSIELVHNRSGSTVVTRTETLPPSGTVRLEIRSPGGYLLNVADESTGATGTYAVIPDHFDCNDRLATVRINGTDIDSRMIQTAMGCGGIFALQ